jgi:triphosphoribosyl-dephospho-CoA synthase
MSGPIPLHSHGTNALLKFGAGGARAQAAAGLPHAIEVGLPALRLGRQLAPKDPEAARVQGFFAILASMEDTNLLHRGGAVGLRYAREAATRFLEQGGFSSRRSGWPLSSAVGDADKRDPVAAAAARASSVARLRVPFCPLPVLWPRAI